MATADRERAIRERLAAATPGEWEWQEALYENRFNALYAIDPQDSDEIDGVVIEETLAGMIIENNADRELIANAPADLRYLLARVDELTRDLAATREALRPFAERYHEANEHNGRRSPIDPDRGYFVAYKHLKQAAALASARDRGDDADGEAG